MKSALKNIAIVLLTSFYTFSVSGFSIKTHYCHGKLVSVSLTAADNKCCCAKKKMPPKCCDSKKVEVKVESKHLKTSEVKNSEYLPLDVKLFPSYAFKDATSILFTKYFHRALIFLRPPQSIYIINCVFRI